MEQLRLVPLETSTSFAERRFLAGRAHFPPNFLDLRQDCISLLKEIMGTSADVLVYNGSPMGGMEAAIVNLFSPGERVLVGIAGKQGERFAELASTFGLATEKFAARPDGSFDLRVLEDLLNEGGFSGLVFAHVDSTTGAMADLRQVGRLARRYSAIFVADVSASLGGTEVSVDEWGIDVTVCASSGGLAGLPGLTALVVGPHAWQAASQSTMPRSYWDFLAYREHAVAERSGLPGEIPGGARSELLWQSLLSGAGQLLSEGLEAAWRRHALMARMVRSAAAVLGLEAAVSDPDAQSPTVTVLRVPEGIPAEALLARLRTRYGVVLGQDVAADGMLSVGHLGVVQPEDVLAAMGFLGRALSDLGHPASTAAAVAAARRAWENPGS